MDFQSFSQAGQDRFAFEVMGRSATGTFLDIGCGHPVSYNNTYGLERLKWTGLLMDIHPEACGYDNRVSKFIQADCRTAMFAGGYITTDYLSLDVDEAGLEVLVNLTNQKMRFRVATIEHDAYRIGKDMRNRMREILWDQGYFLVCADVNWEPGKPFEDWWADPLMTDKNNWCRFCSVDRLPKDILCCAPS